MIEVRVALPFDVASDRRPSIARHLIEPCRCTVRLAEPGDTCASCGRYSLAALLEAATSWYPVETDELLRTFRSVGME